jgi:diguanylate cyclase (GGDEF)-like protein
MSELIERLADLTGYRDRDVLDVTLVGALRDLLQPDCATIYRPVGTPGQQHWLTRARLRRHEHTPRADSLWSAPEDLPPLHALPLHRQCLLEHLATSTEIDGGWLHLFPLSSEHEISGVLELRSGVALDETAQRLVSGILRVYRNFQGLLDYSECDTLTGLLNRKTFDGSFLRVTTPDGFTCGEKRCKSGRRRQPVTSAWLGVVDIDHFKRVNDTHGHLIGDEVLLLLSRLMRGSFRYQDLLYRFGGEEFVVLMRCSDTAQAARVFERMRGNVELYEFPRVGRITVSIGFTQVRAGDTPAAAFERADKAVYHAKNSGRNQVALHESLIESGALVDESHVGDMELF